MKKIYFLLFTLLIASSSYGQELLVNGTFEAWDDATTPTGWTVAESAEQETTVVHGGTSAVKHTGGTSDLGQRISGITPGTSYTLSLWYKVESGDGTDARVWSKWALDGANDNTTDADVLQGVGSSGYFDNNGNEWTEYTTTVTAPATANEFYFEVRTYNGAVVYWDDFSFFQEATAIPTLSVTYPTNGASIPSADVDVEISVQNFTVGNPGAGIDGHIHYTLDGGSVVMKYDTDPISLTGLSIGNHTLDLELVDNSHQPLASPITTSVSFEITGVNQVADITALRAGTIGDFYELTGEAIISYIITDGTRNQKYIQDGGAGILIDDNGGILTTAFNNGDGITGLKGQLTEFNNTLQFVPNENATASSTGNTLTPIVVSASELINNGEAYESRLITLNNVTFADAGTFTDNTSYDVADGSDITVVRVNFGDEDLIGSAIPTGAVSVTGIGGQFIDDYQILPRYISDIAPPLSVNNFNANTFSLYPNPTNTGFVSITSRNSEAISVQVFDILGKQVKNETLTNNTLNVANLKSGVYIVKITQNNTSTTKKLVIK